MVPTFKKTVAGVAELERHTLRLRPELRRLLIMIDGKRSIESLAPFFRANELTTLVDELLQCGAIDTAVQATSYLPGSQYDEQTKTVNTPQDATPSAVVNSPGAAVSTSAASTARGSLSTRQLAAAIAQTKYYAKARFHRGADRFTPQLENCTDSQSLRIIVSDIQLKLIADFGEDAATEFVLSIRDAVRRAT